MISLTKICQRYASDLSRDIVSALRVINLKQRFKLLGCMQEQRMSSVWCGPYVVKIRLEKRAMFIVNCMNLDDFI